jgi:hypothetical protein
MYAMAKPRNPPTFRYARTAQRPREIPPRQPAPGGPTESVEDFLARGGQIEQLDDGARGQPIVSTMREVHEANWRAAQPTKTEPEVT